MFVQTHQLSKQIIKEHNTSKRNKTINIPCLIIVCGIKCVWIIWPPVVCPGITTLIWPAWLIVLEIYFRSSLFHLSNLIHLKVCGFWTVAPLPSLGFTKAIFGAKSIGKMFGLFIWFLSLSGALILLICSYYTVMKDEIRKFSIGKGDVKNGGKLESVLNSQQSRKSLNKKFCFHSLPNTIRLE